MIDTTRKSLIRIKLHEQTGTIILNRPDRRNALDTALIADLSQALSDLQKQRSCRVIIITGAGTAFCSGTDLNEIDAAATQGDAFERWQRDLVELRDLVEKMLRFPKPIIAAVNGDTVAAGMALLLASDLVLAADSASLALSEPRRGLVAGLVAPLLSFRVGAGTASRLLLTGQTMEAPEAHRIGIVHELIEHDLVWARAVEWAGECVASAPEALMLTKKLLNETVGEHLTTLLTAGAAISAAARTTDAAREGVKAFLEKREPDWESLLRDDV
ncbi:MAG: enoyl-CoA hydratase/isomerase family protein [Pirellulales bacterium]|nr:enoyl-CoA hydratase/isomerase family protein [Pirellulales bacterium]